MAILLFVTVCNNSKLEKIHQKYCSGGHLLVLTPGFANASSLAASRFVTGAGPPFARSPACDVDAWPKQSQSRQAA
jgi:hypothetical protein